MKKLNVQVKIPISAIQNDLNKNNPNKDESIHCSGNTLTAPGFPGAYFQFHPDFYPPL